VRGGACKVDGPSLPFFRDSCRPAGACGGGIRGADFRECDTSTYYLTSPRNEKVVMVSQDDAALGKVHVPLGEDGSGLYSAATLGCFSVIENATEMVLKSIDQASIRRKGALGNGTRRRLPAAAGRVVPGTPCCGIVPAVILCRYVACRSICAHEGRRGRNRARDFAPPLRANRQNRVTISGLHPRTPCRAHGYGPMGWAARDRGERRPRGSRRSVPGPGGRPRGGASPAARTGARDTCRPV